MLESIFAFVHLIFKDISAPVARGLRGLPACGLPPSQIWSRKEPGSPSSDKPIPFQGIRSRELMTKTDPFEERRLGEEGLAVIHDSSIPRLNGPLEMPVLETAQPTESNSAWPALQCKV